MADAEATNMSDKKGKGKVQPAPAPAAEAVAEASKLLEEGRALVGSDVDAAIEKIGSALEKQVALYGQLSLETAEFYYMYGHALLTKIENETDPLGDAVGKPGEEGEAQAAPEAPASAPAASKDKPLCGDLLSIEDGSDAEDAPANAKSSGKQPAQAAPKQPEQEESGNEGEEGEEGGEGAAGEGEGEGEGEEADGDMQIAWENLDTARTIWEHYPKGQELNLARVHLRLGDHCLEAEKFTEAAEEFSHALSIRRQHLGPDDRKLMDCYHGLMMAYQLAGDGEKAVEQCDAAVGLAERRLKAIAGSSAAADEAEDLAYIIQGLKEKRAELEESAKESVKQAIAEAVQAVSGGAQAGPAPAPAAAGSSSSAAAGSSSSAAAASAASPAKPTVTQGFDQPSAAASAAVVNDLGVVGRGVKRVRTTPAPSAAPAPAPAQAPASDPADGSAGSPPGAPAPGPVPSTTAPAEPAKKQRRLDSLMEGGDVQIGF
eukprot:tig00021105_g18264.t1